MARNASQEETSQTSLVAQGVSLPTKAGDTGSIPGSRRFHMQRDK